MRKSSIIIASVPWTDTQYPIMAPAAIKGILLSQGIDSFAIDLNAMIVSMLKTHPRRDSIIKFFLTEEVDRESKEDILSILDLMSTTILNHNPSWILLSLLTYLSQIATKWLCMQIRHQRPDAKIVIGGPGASVSLKSIDSFADSLIRQGVIDFYITGDAEESLLALLSGNTNFPGISSKVWNGIADLNQLPIPDFSDYDWSLYKSKRISITGSRGCVRDCTFCDIHEHWNRYQYRTGDNIFAEMIHQKEKYGINLFSFSDSLVNGNQKEFRRLIHSLAEYNAKNPKNQIKWTGSFIIRPKNLMQEKDWKLTADSGAIALSVGVESFVEHIRYHIRKKFSNDDLDFALQMGKKYHIPMILLMIVGYVTETQTDFDEQLKWVRMNRHFANHPVIGVQIGSGLGILPGTWLERNAKTLGITVGNPNVLQDWTNEDIGSTPALRMQWHKKLHDELKNNGFNSEYLRDNHVLIESYLNEKYDTNLLRN